MASEHWYSNVSAVRAVFSSGVAALFAALVIAALAVGGVSDMGVVRLLLVLAWVVGLIGIVFSERVLVRPPRHKKAIAACTAIVLAIALGGLDWRIEAKHARALAQAKVDPTKSNATAPVHDSAVADAVKRIEETLKELKQQQSMPSRHATSGFAVALPSLFMYERDPESWRGHKYGEKPFKLDGSTRLEMPVGSFQRFNPQLMAPEGLSDVILFVVFPGWVEVKPTRLWQKSASDHNRIEYSFDLGNVNPGIIFGVNEAFLFRVSEPRRFNVAYVISGRGERSGAFSPITRVLTVEAR